MESLILSEIPHLNSVYSDEKYLYVPEFDQRITLSAVLTTLSEDNINIYANKIILSGQQQFSIITLPSLEKVFANTEPIVKETLIDGGRKYQLNDKPPAGARFQSRAAIGRVPPERYGTKKYRKPRCISVRAKARWNAPLPKP